MTAEAAAVVRSFRVGRRICTITIPWPRAGEALCATCEWEPDAPNGLSKKERRQYRRGRDAAYAELAAAIGIKIAVVEIA